MAEVHKSVVNSFYDEVLTQKKVNQAGEFVAEDYVDHGGLPGQAPGLEGAKAKWSMYFAAVPDTRTTIEDMLADGDKVAVRWTGEGTHRGICWASLPRGSQSGSAA